MAGNKNLAEDPYERLANAIILQAVTDSVGETITYTRLSGARNLKNGLTL